MKCVTGPIDAESILLRALVLANDPDGSLDWRRLHVLPPGAPYRIDQRGMVYEVAWKKRTHRKSVERCRRAMRDAFEGKVPPSVRATIQTVERRKPLRGERGFELAPTKTLRMWVGPHWWAMKFADGRRVIEGDRWVVPTLDALVEAASSLLVDPSIGRMFDRCPTCGQYFWRPPRWKKAACSDEHQLLYKREKNRARVKRFRNNAR
jgi:hypothetical protein